MIDFGGDFMVYLAVGGGGGEPTMMIVAEPHHLREETLASKILRNELCFSCFCSILQGDDRSTLLGDDK